MIRVRPSLMSWAVAYRLDSSGSMVLYLTMGPATNWGNMDTYSRNLE